VHGSVASRSPQTGASYPQPTCAPIDRLEVVLRPIAGGRTALGVDDQFARLSGAPPVYRGDDSEHSASAPFASFASPGERFNVKARCSVSVHSVYCLSWWCTSQLFSFSAAC